VSAVQSTASQRVMALWLGLLGVVAVGGSTPALAVVGDVGSSSGSVSTATLSAPTSLTATGGLSVVLGWSITASSYATGYDVLRATASGGPYTKIATVTPRTASSYTDAPPLPGTYYYVLQSVYQSWRSVNSNEKSALYI
jgi:hypothetical protein